MPQCPGGGRGYANVVDTVMACLVRALSQKRGPAGKTHTALAQAACQRALRCVSPRSQRWCSSGWKCGTGSGWCKAGNTSCGRTFCSSMSRASCRCPGRERRCCWRDSASGTNEARRWRPRSCRLLNQSRCSGSERLTGAFPDRLTRHARTLEMDGRSGRLKTGNQKRAADAASPGRQALTPPRTDPILQPHPGGPLAKPRLRPATRIGHHHAARQPRFGRLGNLLQRLLRLGLKFCLLPHAGTPPRPVLGLLPRQGQPVRHPQTGLADGKRQRHRRLRSCSACPAEP